MIKRRVLLPLALAVLCSVPAAARDYKLGALEIVEPWTRATPPSAPTAGGFLKLTNTGTTPDRLVGAKSAAAEQVQVHEMKMDGNIMRMRELDHALEIPPGGSVTLAPGGLHLMMIGPKAPLKAGERVPLTLTFEKAGSIDVELVVEPMGTLEPTHKQ
jgi:copper(I)-binding protein